MLPQSNPKPAQVDLGSRDTVCGVFLVVGRPQVPKPVGRGLAQDRRAISVQIEQSIAFGRNRPNVKRLVTVLVLQAEVLALNLQDGAAEAIRVQAREPAY